MRNGGSTTCRGASSRRFPKARARPGAGMAYERILREHATPKTKSALIDAANRMLPEFAKHALWRPKAREFIGSLMETRDRERLHQELEHGRRLAASLGLDVSEVQLPVL